MATTGIDVGVANLLLDAIHAAGAITINSIAFTGPVNIRAMSAIGANDATAGTEITTGNGYTSGGAGLGAPTWAAAATVANVGSKSTNAVLNKTNMPARTIVALEEWSSDGTPKRVMWGAVTSLTTNAGDTVSIASGALTDTFA